MPEPLTAAIREAYATARSDVIFYDTLEIRNPAAAPIYLVQDKINHTFGLEGGGGNKEFIAAAFRLSLPSSGDNGVQELSISIDNVDRAITEWLKLVVDSPDDIQIIYRPYMSTDPTQPQMNPPLVLFLSDIVVTPVEVTGRATFGDILNRKFLTETYNTRRFPAL